MKPWEEEYPDGFEPIKRTYGNGDPRAANSGRVKRRLKDARQLGNRRHRGTKH